LTTGARFPVGLSEGSSDVQTSLHVFPSRQVCPIRSPVTRGRTARAPACGDPSLVGIFLGAPCSVLVDHLPAAPFSFHAPRLGAFAACSAGPIPRGPQA